VEPRDNSSLTVIICKGLFFSPRVRKEWPVAGPVDAMRLEKSSRLRMIAERAGKKIHARG